MKVWGFTSCSGFQRLLGERITQLYSSRYHGNWLNLKLFYLSHKDHELERNDHLVFQETVEELKNCIRIIRKWILCVSTRTYPYQEMLTIWHRNIAMSSWHHSYDLVTSDWFIYKPQIVSLTLLDSLHNCDTVQAPPTSEATCEDRQRDLAFPFPRLLQTPPSIKLDPSRLNVSQDSLRLLTNFLVPWATAVALLGDSGEGRTHWL